MKRTFITGFLFFCCGNALQAVNPNVFEQRMLVLLMMDMNKPEKNSFPCFKDHQKKIRLQQQKQLKMLLLGKKYKHQGRNGVRY